MSNSEPKNITRWLGFSRYGTLTITSLPLYDVENAQITNFSLWLETMSQAFWYVPDRLKPNIKNQL